MAIIVPLTASGCYGIHNGGQYQTSGQQVVVEARMVGPLPHAGIGTPYAVSHISARIVVGQRFVGIGVLLLALLVLHSSRDSYPVGIVAYRRACHIALNLKEVALYDILLISILNIPRQYGLSLTVEYRLQLAGIVHHL